MNQIKEFVSTDEAAHRLGVSKTKIQRWCLDGTLWFAIAAVDDDGNRTFRIPREAFERFMRGELVKPSMYDEAVKDFLRFLQGIGVTV